MSVGDLAARGSPVFRMGDLPIGLLSILGVVFFDLGVVFSSRGVSFERSNSRERIGRSSAEHGELQTDEAINETP